MRALLPFSRAIDWCAELIGRAVAWLILAAVLVSAANAGLRKLISLDPQGPLARPFMQWYIRHSNAWVELQWQLFAAVFLLAAAYTLQRNEHVRIDVVSGRFSRRTRDWIDLFGHSFMLLPFAALMIYVALPYVRSSYRLGERSANAGGLILWPAKALIVAGFALLFLQGVSELIKRIAVMRGLIDDPGADSQPHPAVEEQLALKGPGG